MSPRALKLLAVADHAGRAGGCGGDRRCGARLSAYPGRAAARPVSETVVVLPRGAGLDAITAQLDAAGVIERPWLFRLAVRLRARTARSRPASTPSRPAVTPASVINMLARGETVARRLTVAEGLTVAEMFRLLAETDGLTGELPRAAARRQPAAGDLLLRAGRRARRAGAAHAARRCAGCSTSCGRRAPRPCRSPTGSEALILASIVDKETGVAGGARRRSPRCSSTGCATACACSPIRR